MKLRIKDDSIRLRLTQTEVAQMYEEGRVAATVHFGPSRLLTYALEASPAVDRLTARYNNHTVVVQVPRGWVGPWATGDRVGFEGTQPIGNGRMLELLVEKDFQCLHKEDDEREADAYPHPLETEH